MSEDASVEEVGDVEWLEDADGTEYFIEDGVRYELAEDGYAYPVDDPATLDKDESAAAPARGPDDEAPTKRSDEVSRPGKESRKERKAREKAEKAAAAAAEAEDGPAPFSEQAASTVSVKERTADLPAPGGDAVHLRLDGLKSGYGKLPVLHGVDFEIRRGETAVMLGLNGAGKTTTAMNIAGALQAWGGTIEFEGQDITTWSSRECVSNGLVMVPEGRRVFPELSVARNLQVGAWSQRGEKGYQEAQREVVFDYFPRLRERTDQLAGTLSGGEQQMLAVGRGLMANPRFLIIDEASMGLAPVIVKDVFDIVAQISNDGVTVLLIEQNVGALEVADVGFVMEQGRLVKTLRGDDLNDRSQVTEILMG